ncbi:hypothetical protein TNIN_40761 [Trichonephila inaurata madagascariensis]|uniref:Uncharacterized protein n=1 Tax=Trichonephila inaurata madagascariensis TaxID=2747483 RepID=A0A8X6I783_9ARAC|nr:hypothetical protein TNIN_40761 [Trichonephila inaurata madagascariensis]
MSQKFPQRFPTRFLSIPLSRRPLELNKRNFFPHSPVNGNYSNNVARNLCYNESKQTTTSGDKTCEYRADLLTVFFFFSHGDTCEDYCAVSEGWGRWVK